MPNTLYFGDNLTVLRDRIASESVDLIYLDPPFNSNRNYFVLFKDRTGKASAAQDEAFTDTWTWTEETEAAYKELVIGCNNRALATTIQALRTVLCEAPLMAYLVMMSARLLELHRVLKSTGSLYLHCDPTASHYLKLVLDVIFGPQQFKNEIVWKRQSGHSDAKQGSRHYGRIHDVILFYAKGDCYTWNHMYQPYDPEYVSTFYNNVEASTGRHFQYGDLTGPGGAAKGNPQYEFLGVTRFWRYSKEKMEQLYREGRIEFRPKGNVPRLKRYLDEARGIPLQSVWTDVRPLINFGNEALGYPTQKPLALLERIIAASSNPGDVVLDPFCGCGTAVVAAHKLGRKWIGIDITAVAIAVIKARMEAFEDLKGKIVIDGFPRDFESARQLFEIDPYRFQAWACNLISAYPLLKKGADNGIDGWLNFLDLDDSTHRAIVQIKGGKVSVAQVRDFCHVVAREKASLGFFVCMGDVTRPMHTEAIKEGFWESAGGKSYPRIQILPIAEIFAGLTGPQYPPQDKRSILGFNASKQQRQGLQAALFDHE